VNCTLPTSYGPKFAPKKLSSFDAMDMIKIDSKEGLVAMQ
jgi:hypothetical protein